ncbi:MAG: DUF4340 domain-containing protein [Steroidobacteraceae bacterium]
MTARRVTILLIAAVLVIVLAVWLSSKRQVERGTLAGDPVVTGLEKGALNSITEVRLAKGDGTRTTLKKGASDWTVGEREYPADSGKVRKLLLDLAALNVVEEKTRTPENYPLLGVEDTSSAKATGTRVDVVTAAKTYSLIVGKSSGAKSGYVRVVNAPQSFLAAPLITLDADPKRWLDHTLIDIPQDRIKEFAVKPAQGAAYSATRPSKEQADFAVAEVPKGRELSSPAAADPIAGSLAGVSLDDVQRAPQTAPAGVPAGDVTPAGGSLADRSVAAAAAPVSHVVFSTFDGLKIDVAGRKDGSRTLVSLTPSSTAKETEAEAKTLAARLNGWEYEIPSYKYDGMFRPLEDLLKKPPEPAAKGAKGKAGEKDAARPGKKSAPPADPASPGSPRN